MAIQTKTTLKSYFNTDDIPPEGHFGDLIDSTVNFDSTSGSTNTIPKFTSASGVGNSNISDDGTNIIIADGKNIATGTGSGTLIGTSGSSTGQKLGFFGGGTSGSPIVQPVLTTSASATVDDIITVLQALGLVRQS